MVKFNSTIFRTIKDEATGANKSIGLFGKSFAELKNIISSVKTNGLFNTSTISEADVECIKKYNNAIALNIPHQQAMEQATKGASDVTKQMIKNANGNTIALNQMTLGTKAASVAMKALSIAGNMIVFWAITKGIELAVSAIDDYIHRAEKCKERVEEMISTFDSAIDTVNSHKKTIDEIGSRYEELSKGVNNLGENVSLTAEEYQEYNSIVNDIAEMFPTMVQGYTDEGNAILKLKGNVDDLREAYEAEAQAAYNSLISTGKDSDGNDILKDANNVITGSTLGAHDWGNAEKIDYLDKLMDATDSVDSMLNLWDESLNSAYSEWFEDFAGVGGTVNIGKLTDEDLANIRKNAKILKQQYQAEIDSAVDNAETLANAYLMTNEDYAKLDEQSKNAASIMVNSLNADIVSKFGEDKENVGKYVDDIVQIISTNPDAKDAMIGLFTMDTTDMPVDDIQYWTNAYIDTIAKILQEDPAELKIRLGFDNDTTEPLKTKVQGFLKDEFDGKIGELTLDELDAASKLEIPEGTLLSWDELIAKIEEAKNASSDETDILSFSDAWEKLKNSTEDATKGLADDLIKLAESGQLTAEALTKADTSEFFKKSGISAEEATRQINALVDSATQLKSMSDQVSKMADLLADKKNGTTASVSDFTGFDDTVKGMDSWEEYKTVMGDTNSTLEECQRVSNALATEWANSGEFLSQLTDKTKDFYVTQLSLMGVENAQEVVESRLAQKKADVAAAQDYKNFVEESGLDITNNLSEVIGGEITQLQKQGVITDNTANSLSRYVVKKAMVNGVTLDTNKDIQHLANLAGATTELGDLLIQLAKIKSQALNPSLGITPEMEEGMTKGIKERIQKYLNGDTDDYNIEIPDLSIDDNGADGYKNSSSSSEKSKQKFDWIETLFSRIERKIKNLGNTVSATWKSWSTRNDALAKELSSITDEINAQQKAYDTYMSYANGVGLSDYYKQLVQSGDYKIEEIGDDTLKEQIELYKEYYEKALDCADAVDTLQNNLADLAKTKFDNVGKQFDEQLQSITHSIDMTEATIDNIETKAYIVSGDYYNKLINLQKQNIAGLQEKYVGLQNAMNEAINSGNIAKYSEEWYELQDSVNSAEKAVIDADKALLEYENDLRQLNWDIFDKTEDYISKVQEESNFLIDLMSNSKLFNDTGKATDNGMASLGLHAVNLNAYMSQADDYAKEIQRISKDIADDPYNVTLIERRQELIKSQQDMIKNAEEEKQAIKSLISDGYNTMLDALNKLIDKRKEFLNAQKDAYDYQKNIQEQTKEIANYQKQLQALQGDMSEETRSKVQQIKVSLEEAQTKLQETEYDKWVSDTEQMLDMLSSETESWINERLDNLDGLITEVIDTTNANADNIQTTLQQVGEDVGYSLTPEMDKIWETNDGLNNVVTQYTNSFETHMTTVQDTLNGIKDLIQQMSGGSTNGAGSGVNGVNNAPSNGNTGATTTPNTSPTTSNPKTNNSGGDGKANVGDSVIFDNGVYHEDEYGNGRSGAYKLGQTVYITKINPNSQYPYHISQTNKLHEHDLGWVRLDQLRGYAKGSRYIKDDQLAFTQENGGEIIYRAKDGAILTPLNSGDMVFTAEMSNKLWEIAKGNMNVPSIAPSVPKFVANTNNGVTTGDTNVSLTLNLPNVTSYNEFKQALLNDNSFSKAMADKTIGVSLGKNSLLYKTR